MQINIWAVLVSAVVSMIIGSIWYGPLFGKMFMREMGMDAMSPEKKAEMRKGMMMSYVWQFIASFVMFFVLAHFIGMMSMYAGAAGTITVGSAMQLIFWIWIGFVVPLALGKALWGGKMSLFWLEISNMLVTLAAAGAILAVWK